MFLFVILCVVLIASTKCHFPLGPVAFQNTFERKSEGSRLNFDDCISSDQCLPPRRCSSLEFQNERVCPGTGVCFCYSKLLCSPDDDSKSSCAPDEICYRGLCESTAKHSTPTPEAAEQSVSGLAFESCSSDEECATGYECVLNLGQNLRVPCPSGAPAGSCVCFSADFICLSTSQCHSQEFCFRPLGIERAACVSKQGFQLFEPSPSLPPDAERNGTLFNFEHCNSSLDCVPPRECIRIRNGTNVVCDVPHPDCVCQAHLSMCHINSYCERGETCVFLDGLSGSWCKASALVEERNASATATKLGLERCEHTWECVTPRRCARFYEGGLFDECNGHADCFCLDTEYRCFRDDECDADEQCEPFEEVSVCVARNVVASGSIPIREMLEASAEGEEEEEDSGTNAIPLEIPPEPPSAASDESVEQSSVCIAVHHLKHLPADQLMYRSHRRATVLCDAVGNCATKSHMLLFEGRAMSMATYCGRVRCVRRTMWVNSPKYVPRLRVDGVGGVRWTAFAASFGTALEERVLAALVAVGL